MIKNPTESPSLLDQLLAIPEFDPELCPTVNGYGVNQISLADTDAPAISEFVQICEKFNRFRYELHLLEKRPEEVAAEDRKSVIEKLTSVADLKAALDKKYEMEGVIANADISNGFVKDIVYTSPRPEWNHARNRRIQIFGNTDDFQSS